MSPAAQELMARHYQALASLSDEQRVAIGRRDLARNEGNLNHRTERDNLERLFERIAKQGSA